MSTPKIRTPDPGPHEIWRGRELYRENPVPQIWDRACELVGSDALNDFNHCVTIVRTYPAIAEAVYDVLVCDDLTLPEWVKALGEAAEAAAADYAHDNLQDKVWEKYHDLLSGGLE